MTACTTSDSLTPGGCETDCSPPPVMSVTVSLASETLQLGQGTQASATLKDANNVTLTGRSVSWQSDNSAIAAVTQLGAVTTGGLGVAHISATSEGHTGSATLTVIASPPPPPAPVATVSVSLAASALTVGQSTQATATLKDANGGALSGRAVTWGSADSAIATVSGSGLVTAVGAGSTRIIAASESKSGSTTLTVTAVTPPPPPPPPTGDHWVSGYYVGYQRSLLPESAIDFSALTHIIVGRIRPTASGGLITDFDIDNVNGPAMARNVSTRAHQAGRKAILMLGGAGDRNAFIGAASNTNRAAFVQKLISAMTDYGYDGIDVDWEPIDPADYTNLLALMKDLRAARPSMLLTIPVGFVNANYAAQDSWFGQLAAVVDQINIMSYDMAGAYSGWVSWHSDALDDAQSNHPSSVVSSVNGYKAGGVPAAKLGVGIPFYGDCWRGVTGPRQAISGSTSMVAGDNVMSYSNIMSQYFDASARKWDTAASVPYLSFATGHGPQACTFISYEDEESIAAKGAWAKANGVGGAMIWTINQGHLSNAAAGQQDPLLKATYNAFIQ